jgi:hypothetical protein
MKPSEIEVVKQFFFRGMLDGYVNPNPVKFKDLQISFPFQIPFPPVMKFASYCLFGSKCTVYHEEIDGKHFLLIDIWFSTKKSDFSGGMTLIIVDNEMVWMMNDGGHFPEEVIPTLKLALKSAYEQKLFVGGRGPAEFRNGDYLYDNVLQHQDNNGGGMHDFYGFENIFESGTEESGKINESGRINPIKYWCGQHHYHGFLLVPVEEEEAEKATETSDKSAVPDPKKSDIFGSDTKPCPQCGTPVENGQKCPHCAESKSFN